MSRTSLDDTSDQLNLLLITADITEPKIMKNTCARAPSYSR